jgi:hypothetical protein
MMKYTWVTLLCLVLIVVSGCDVTKEYRSQLSLQMNSCIGKLTSADVLMFASSPSEKNVVKDGEIWIYKYRKSKTSFTTTGTGGFLLPYNTEEKTDNYRYDVRLRFNEKGVLTQWTADGDLVRGDSRYQGIAVDEVPFFTHHCN